MICQIHLTYFVTESIQHEKTSEEASRTYEGHYHPTGVTDEQKVPIIAKSIITPSGMSEWVKTEYLHTKRSNNSSSEAI